MAGCRSTRSAARPFGERALGCVFGSVVNSCWTMSALPIRTASREAHRLSTRRGERVHAVPTSTGSRQDTHVDNSALARVMNKENHLSCQVREGQALSCNCTYRGFSGALRGYPPL